MAYKLTVSLWPTMIDRQTLNVTHSSAIAHRYTVLLTLPDRKMPLMEAGAAISRLCTMLRNFQIAHTCYAIFRLPVQSWDSENVQRNLEIAQILRLSGTYMICQGAWVN